MTTFLNWAGKEISAAEAKLEQAAGRAVTHLDGAATTIYEWFATHPEGDDVPLKPVPEPEVAPEPEPEPEPDPPTPKVEKPKKQDKKKDEEPPAPEQPKDDSDGSEKPTGEAGDTPEADKSEQ